MELLNLNRIQPAEAEAVATEYEYLQRLQAEVQKVQKGLAQCERWVETFKEEQQACQTTCTMEAQDLLGRVPTTNGCRVCIYIYIYIHAEGVCMPIYIYIHIQIHLFMYAQKYVNT